MGNKRGGSSHLGAAFMMVPNVVYSCGSVAHEDTVVVPYGCSDSSIRFAFVDLPGLLTLLR